MQNYNFKKFGISSLFIFILFFLLCLAVVKDTWIKIILGVLVILEIITITICTYLIICKPTEKRKCIYRFIQLILFNCFFYVILLGYCQTWRCKISHILLIINILFMFIGILLSKSNKAEKIKTMKGIKKSTAYVIVGISVVLFKILLPLLSDQIIGGLIIFLMELLNVSFIFITGLSLVKFYNVFKINNENVD